MTRYIEAFSWPSSIQEFLDTAVPERPLFNVCAGATAWGDVTGDRWYPAMLKVDWARPWPFRDDAFGAVFADPPWNWCYRRQVKAFLAEALRVAPVVYLMAPWIYGASWCHLDRTWVRQLPGINQAITLTRYCRVPGPS